MSLRAIAGPALRPVRPIFSCPPLPVQCSSSFTSVAFKRPQTQLSMQLKPISNALFRRAYADKIDRDAEKRYAKERIKPTPETVSTTSSIHPIVGEVGGETVRQDVDMMANVKHDVHTIQETFDMSNVPRQAYYIGLAGVLPYLATSLSTVYCAWEINHAVAGYGFMMSARTAETLLHVLEPLQVGYGAVILSFLGAIHWGLEWAGFGGYQGYKRYAIGVVAPAVAWPTVLMPVEYALITQFGAFVLLYYVDTRAAYRGWTPTWYAIYRFTLTFIVGASIVVSLIGRGEVSDRVGRLPGAVERINALRGNSKEALAEAEESIRVENAIKAKKSGGDEGKDE